MTNKKTITVTVEVEQENLSQEETDTWITINPTSFYHDACLSKGYCTAEQYLVINYSKWIKWYQISNNQNLRVLLTVPQPAFVGDTYAIALAVADELNKSTNLTEGATI
jgi:hypothetical protein